MDIGRTLSRAWQISWRWKVLWILGFLAALGQGTSGANSSYRFSSSDLQNMNLPNINVPAAEGLLVGLACLGIIVAIALFVISVMARGGLIVGVAQVEAEGRTTLGEAWTAGQRRFWTLFGIGVLSVLPIIVISIVMVIGIFLVAGGAALVGARGDNAVGPVIGGLLACICPSVCLLIVVAAVLAQIRIYAERAAMLENLGWIDAFGRGWRVLRTNLGPTVLLWIVFLVLGLIVGAVTLAIMVPIMLPLAAMFGNAANNTNSLLLVPLCGVGLVGVVLAAIVGAIITTFTSATWTLAYREMTAPAAPLVPPPASPLEG